MRFIDSNILAYAFYNNAHIDSCQSVLKEGGVIDSLNLIEAFFIIEKETNRDNAVKAIRTLLKLNVQIISIDVNLVFEAVKRVAKYKLSFFDLIHYTAALMNNCSEIVSFDSDFDNLEIKRVTS